jgi:uncharacterized protein with HEPN domain
MYDKTLLIDKLEQIYEALIRIERRFSGIGSPSDFTTTEINQDRLDAIAMLLIAVGESFKKIEKETEGKFLKKYLEIDWKGVIGVRDVLAHDYFDLDVEEIYKICKYDISRLKEVVSTMLEAVKTSGTDGNK